MPDTDISQTEADLLLALEKHRIDETEHDYPGTGGSIRVPLISADRRENFVLDVTRSQINIAKGTYQNRGRNVVVLARLDFGGPTHRNPDDVEVPCPHLHLYREGYGDKWAVPLPAGVFADIADPWQTLHDFMRFVNVTQPPRIVRGLFV